MTSTMLFGVEYVLVSCGKEGCDQSFGMSLRFYDETRRTGNCWHCPSGHPRIWAGKTTEQQLADAQARETALQDQLTAAVNEAEQTRVALLRDRQRFANGVCPCCNRSFENVRRHMATKHPDYDVTKVKQGVPRQFGCSCGRKFDTLIGLRVHQGHVREATGSWAWDKPDTPRWASHLTVV